MKNIKIIDCDRHVIEPLDMWAKYTEKSILKEFPIRLEFDTKERQQKRGEIFGVEVSLPPTYMLGDQPILSNWDERQQIATACLKRESREEIKRATHPRGQIESMDSSAVDRAQIFPTFAMYVVNHKSISSAGSLAYAQAYNRWLFDYCEYNKQRLIGVGMVSLFDPAQLKPQIDEIVNFGWKAITIRPEPQRGKNLGHPDFDPLWQACEYHNIAVAFHGGTHLQGDTVGMERFSDRFSLHACSHPMEAQMAFVSLLSAGVLERFPKLKFGFLEAGASWVPHWLWRLDNICYPEFPGLVKDNIKMLPSEYFKRQCWVTIEPGEPCLRQVIDAVGCQSLLYGSDYPHPDHLHLSSEDISESLVDLTEVEVEELLVANAKKFYGIDDTFGKHLLDENELEESL